jgi:hypothetical protein
LLDVFAMSTLLSDRSWSVIPVESDSLVLFPSSRFLLDCASEMPALFALTSLPSRRLLSAR